MSSPMPNSWLPGSFPVICKYGTDNYNDDEMIEKNHLQVSLDCFFSIVIYRSIYC